jgi:cellulose synthase/poly-beta-1,6-N-acetylglucosamine synthase-like glycosyltransferase
MVTDLFLLSAIWSVLAVFAALALGTRVRHSDFFTSMLYLALVVIAGDVIAGWWWGFPTQVLLAGLVAMAIGVPFILMLSDWNAPGQVMFLFIVTTTLAYLVYAFAVTAFSPVSPMAFLFSFLLFMLETAALTLSLTYAFEVLDVLCRVRWRHRAAPKSLGSYAPMVSLHVPAYNEPPELVEKTLRSLANLDYPFYEVILVDNNTPSEATWQPLAEVCREYGFKCLHLDRWPGYKSGALNFALAMTDPRAEIIGVIDADYIVQPDYLRRLVPYLEEPEIAFVQAPQDYRDYEQNRFFQAMYDGYRYFFALSMPARNERNAIIFCGTMGLLRKKVLQEIGGWDEWCITEDAEASLRILNRGYKAIYVDESFGRGLMPLDFEGLKKQRFRWAFGGVQVLKKHWNQLMPWARWIDPNGKMTAGQRYFYLVAGLQWFNELLTFAFTIMVLISAFLTVMGETELLRPTTEAFVILPLVLIGTNMLRALWGLRYALSLSWRRAFDALTLWFSLTWVVALACVQAMIRQRGVFLRTPKAVTNVAWLRAVQATSWETTLGVACLIGGVSAFVRLPAPLTVGLFLLCLTQALIYLSAPSHSLASLAATARHAVQSDRGYIYGSFANESRLGMQVGLAALALLAVAFVASWWPSPNKLPWYSVLNPQPAAIQQLPNQAPPPILPGRGNGNTGKKNPSPTPTPSATPRGTPTLTPATPTASPTPSPTPSPPATNTATSSPTPSRTPTASPSPSPTATPRASPTPSRSPTVCPTPTSSPTPASSPTPTSPPTQTSTPSPTPVC